jgi:hypothetical protein
MERLSETDAGCEIYQIESIVEGAATTEHYQNTRLRVWEIPGKNPNWMTGGLPNGS